MRLKVFLTFNLACLALFSFAQTGSEFQKELKELYSHKRFIQLKSKLQQHDYLPEKQRLFYNIVLANAFNQCGQSNRLLEQFQKKYQNHLPDSTTIQLEEIKADNFIKLYQYRKAAACYDLLIDRYKSHTDSATRADWRNSKALWLAIATVPAQQVINNHTTIVKWVKDKNALIQLTVNHQQDSCSLVFDTGANLSVITASNARKLGMKIYEASIDVPSGISGKVSKTSLAVADTLYLGGILIKNAVFLLVSDELLDFKAMGYQQSGLIGEPVIAQLKEMTIYKDGRFEIPCNPSKNHGQNLFLNGLTPIVNFSVAKDDLPYGFDTGASNSVLYEPFFDRYKTYVLKHGAQHILRSSGVGGGVVESPSYTLTNFEISVAGCKAALPKINVRTTPVGTDKDVFFGNIGEDLFQQFKSMTINFQSMFVSAKK